MFALYDIGMAASAVQVNPASVFSKMGLMIKNDIPSGKIFFRFDQSFLMAARLQALRVRDPGQGPGIIGPQNKTELSGKGVQRSVLMAFEAGDHIVGRSRPLIVKRSNKMTIFADRRLLYHYFFHQKIRYNRKREKDAKEYYRYLPSHDPVVHGVLYKIGSFYKLTISKQIIHRKNHEKSNA
jgi:hypothetical protein